MWKPLIRCSIIGGVVVFLWMIVTWTVLPMHRATLDNFTDETEVSSCITRYAPHDGIYAIPSWAEHEKAQKEGTSPPSIFVNIARGIDYSNMAKNIVIGFITQIIAAAFVTYLLLKGKAMKYWNRVWFVTVVGIVVGILSGVPAWNWWHFPLSWALLEFFDMTVGWFLGGLVIAKLVKN